MRRAFVLCVALATTLAPTLGPYPPEAKAAVSIALGLDELVGASSGCVVATAAESRSEWVDLGGGRRIVTLTRLTVERTVFGRRQDSIWVRTLGGAVGHIGQVVSGEARLRLGERALVLLRRAPDGVLTVTALGQGHFPVVERDGRPVLVGSPDPGTLLRRRPAATARDALVGATLPAAVSLVEAAVARRDAQP